MRVYCGPMPTHPPWLRTLLLPLATAGCVPDDWNGAPYGADSGAPAAVTAETDSGVASTGSALDGQWLSEGDDVSPLFSSPLFGYVRVDAWFGPGDAYVTVVTDAAGASATLSGTFTVDGDASGAGPAIVTLDQDQPYVAAAVGICQVTSGPPDALTWEVVQVNPDYGYTPPTPASGFGSTAGPGLTAGANVQRYVRVAR